MKNASGHGSEKGNSAVPIADRFWSKVDRRGPDECWFWTAASTHGYGYICTRSIGPRRSTEAHRVAYELLVGPIPEGLTLDHYRLNPGPRQAPCSTKCVNPAHLEPVPQRENVIRGNSPSAQCSRKTHCVHDHPFDNANTHVRPNGARRCRACDRDQHRGRRNSSLLDRAADALEAAS